MNELYGPLIKWVAFINNPDKAALPPGLDVQHIRDERTVRYFRQRHRDEALGFLREIAAVRQAPVGPFGNIPIIEGPPSRFTITENRLVEVVANTVPRLVDALKGRDVDRLRICPICDKLFVALNDRSKTCGAICSNRQSARDHYSKHREHEQKRKREAYQAKMEEERRREERRKAFDAERVAIRNRARD
ncbi:MAG: hypothetical protein WCA22_04090 [Candidatus Binatus sp.]